MEMDPTEKLVLKIREDVETRPIEVNVKSAGVSEEEQVFFTEEDNETEERFGNGKNNLKRDSRSLSQYYILIQLRKNPTGGIF